MSESGDLFFLKLGDGPWRHVTQGEWVSAERAAGFRPKGADCGQPATAGFGSSHGIQGETFSREYGRVDAYDEFDPEYAEAVRSALGIEVTG